MTDQSSPITIRTAEAHDLPSLALLRREWSPAAEIDPSFSRRLAEWFATERDRRTIWLALQGEDSVGMVSLVEFRRMPKPGQPTSCWGYVGQLFVSAPQRGRGIGQRLLDQVITTATDRDYTRLVLSPSPEARRLCQRAGFHRADATSGSSLLTRESIGSSP